MADSLTDIVKSPVTFTIFSDGSQLPDKIVVNSIMVSKAINKIAIANIQLYDGGLSDSVSFTASDEQLFNPGKSIEIKAGYQSSEETIFKGIVIRHGLKVSKTRGFMMSVECKDEAIKLTIGRKNALFTEKTDSDIISEILSEYSDLTTSVDSTSFENPELIQNYTSNWDYIMQRAEINGLVIINSDNELKVTVPTLNAAVLDVDPGTGLRDFNGYIDARNQFGTIKASSWDRENQALLSEESSSAPDNPGGNISLTDLSDVIGLDVFNLQTTSSIPSDVLQQWAASKHLKSSFSKIQGTFTIHGYPNLKLGDSINLSGLSDQFNGQLYVGGLKHYIENGDFSTEVQIGISASFFSDEYRDIPSPGASGLLSPIKGLHIGVVEQIHEDDNGEFRIKVQLPSLGVDNLSVWARQVNFYATAEAGLFFYPEISDEVIVGFLNEDPQSPIILGSMYNKNNSVPPFDPTEENYTKAIVTKTGLSILFDEENDAITFITPEEQKITMNDTDGIVSIEDKNNNKIEMSDSGISITSDGDITIESTKSNITQTAKGDIELTATGDLTGSGMNVSLEAKTAFKSKGTTADLEASGQAKVKGAIVMIN